MGTKNKIQLLNRIETKVKDLAKELTKIAVTVGSGTHSGGITTFTVNTITGFNAGDDVYIYDGTANSAFTTVNSIVESPKQIKLNGNFSSILGGATIKKTDGVEHLESAINIYSKYRPLERIYKPDPFFAGVIYSLPADWENEFSSIKYIEHPIDNTPERRLNDKNYRVFLNDSNVYQLKFDVSLSSVFRMMYTIRHSFSSANPPVISAPDNDFDCICDLGAAKYLLALAARYGQSVNPIIGADSVNYDNKTDQFRRLAKVYFGQAANWLGITVSDLDGTDLEQASGAVIQKLEPANSDGGATLLQNQIPIIQN